jgi:16S rRNA pseudouridine516 synthase
VGNRVEGLHRWKIGGLELPATMEPGRWRWLTAADLELPP